MITTHRSKLEQRCRTRGYTMAQVEGCVVKKEGDKWTIDEFHPDYPRPRGPGTVLKELLGYFKIAPKDSCSCIDNARAMDENGPEWCRANMDTIIQWLREAAKERGLPFIEIAARALVNKAISDYEAIPMPRVGSTQT